MAFPYFSLVHFLVFEISPVYISYGGDKSFILKIGKARERIRLEDALGVKVDPHESNGVVNVTRGSLTFEDRVDCKVQGIKAAMWSLNPSFSFTEQQTVCFSPAKMWKQPNLLGVFHLISLTATVVPIVCWCYRLIDQKIWDWGGARYLAFTERLQSSGAYTTLRYFTLWFPLVLTVYGVGTVVVGHGLRATCSFFAYSWPELLAMFLPTKSMLSRWTAPFDLEDPAVLELHFVRDLKHFKECNDEFGKKITEALVKAHNGDDTMVQEMLRTPEEWHLLMPCHEAMHAAKVRGSVIQLPSDQCCLLGPKC